MTQGGYPVTRNTHPDCNVGTELPSLTSNKFIVTVHYVERI